jgi:hypothetical protein
MSANAPSTLIFQTVSSKTNPIIATVAGLVLVVILMLLFALIARWLWNKTLVPHVTTIKPIASVWTMLGILVLFRIFFMRLL